MAAKQKWISQARIEGAPIVNISLQKKMPTPGGELCRPGHVGTWPQIAIIWRELAKTVRKQLLIFV